MARIHTTNLLSQVFFPDSTNLHMKPNNTLTLQLKESGDKGGNVWESREEEKERGKMPRLRHRPSFPKKTGELVKIQGYK